jgi:hypothetical protein
METESKEVIELLEKKGHQFAESYMKNIHRCVVDMEQAIQESRKLLKSVYSVGDIKAGDNKELYSKHERILDSYYKFVERLERLSSEIKVGPSFHKIDQTLRKARGASVHVKESVHRYVTPGGTVGCPTDSVVYPYEGTCFSVEVEFDDPKHSFQYTTLLEKLLDDIQLSVEWTLRKYIRALE